MILLAALLCLMLCGCTFPSTAQSLPPEPAPETALSLPYALESAPLPVSHVRRIEATSQGLWVISGQDSTTLTLLDSSLNQTAALTLEDASPELQIGDVLCWYRESTREAVILDSRLQPLHQVRLPGDLAGTPLLSQDGHTLYYSTSTGLYGWDLTSGIRRRIKDFSGSAQVLTGIHWGDTVLECRGQDGSVSFHSAQSGQLLCRREEALSLITQGGAYYAAFPQGFRQALVFGTDPEAPRALLPRDLWSQGRFLPTLDAAVTLSHSDDAVRLDAYRLSSGRALDSLTLDPLHTPLDLTVWQDIIVLLVYDPTQACFALLYWQPTETEDTAPFTDRHYPDQSPNQNGLTVCQSRANALSQKYGITVKLWEDAIRQQPWDYTFTPEHQYQTLLQTLQQLDDALSRLPPDMLRQTAAHFHRLNLCLVRSIHPCTGNALAAATGIQFLEDGEATVALAPGPYFSQAVYHELFHVMETHIFTGSKALDHWESLNPAGFAYDLSFGANARRNSGIYLDGIHRAFVDTYSMSYPKEDRARIFEYAMLPNQAELFRAPILQAKLAALCRGLREAYGLKTPEKLPWEQYLQG